MKGLLLSLACALLIVSSAHAGPKDAPNVGGAAKTPPNQPAAPPKPKGGPPPDATTAAPNTITGVKATAIKGSDDNNNAERAKRESLRAAIVPSNSFTPPFDEYDESTGERMIHSAWTLGGDTDVHENFVRLTNDRQSKAGWLHNNEPIAMLDFSVYVNFRISGAGQRLFGDGIAIWVTDATASDFRRGGDFFAGPTDFKGFVILLDTFKNAEMGANHKDVMLFVNDGTEDVDILNPDAGNTANYRYYEGRDDFSVLDYSALHLMYRASTKTVTVMLDEKNTGEYRTIIEHKIDGMPRGWDNELRLSFSATTGQLADNHDLLSVKLIKAGGRLPRSVEEEAVNPREIQSLERQVQKQSGGAQIAKLMKLYRRDAEMRLNHLHHAIEHELSFIQDSLASAINKIKAAEKEDQLRIDVLEAKAEEVAKQMLEQHVAATVSSHVEDKLGGEVERRIDEHAARMRDEVDTRMGHITSKQATMEQKVLAKAAEHAAAGGGGGAGWVSLLFIVGCFAAVAFYLSRRVSRMEKNHLP